MARLTVWSRTQLSQSNAAMLARFSASPARLARAYCGAAPLNNGPPSRYQSQSAQLKLACSSS
jgi:hypothetical protein